MADLPEHNVTAPPIETPKRTNSADIIRVLESYRTESETARDSGPSPRTTIWAANWERYWGRYDFSKKAAWQSQHVLPEVPQYVDRWAAAMRESLDSGGDWFTAEDEAGVGITTDLIPKINRLMRVLLGRCSRTPDGQPASFNSLFEEQMKLGAMMALCSAVTWKADAQGGYVAVDTVDPRECWFDPKGRGLYRRRHYEIDKHELVALASRKDEFGLPIYNLEEIALLDAEANDISNTNRQNSTGSGTGTDTGRKPIQIDEWRATVLDPLTDKVIADRALMIVANRKYLIRGPEFNPYNHNKDWIVFTPMVSVPMSIYGRTYMEDWSSTADAFVEMTNLILDAAQTSAMKAFVVQAEMLADPTQLLEGISPNALFQLAEGMPVADFLKEIELGNLPPEAVTIWQALKSELREGAKLSEISLGQMPDKTHIAATAVNQAGQSGSSMMRSMAKTIEQRYLEPTLTMVWETALQYMDFMSLAPEIGEDDARMFQAAREDFAHRKFKFRVRGLSGLIDRQQKLGNLLQMIQTIAQNPTLLMAFMQNTNLPKLLKSLQTYFGVDPAMYEYTEAERMLQQVQQNASGAVPGPMPPAQPAAAPAAAPKAPPGRPPG